MQKVKTDWIFYTEVEKVRCKPCKVDIVWSCYIFTGVTFVIQ